jgi:pyruvate carboxylase
VTVVDRSLEVTDAGRPKATAGDPKQVAAPMPGMVVTVAVQEGNSVSKGQKLLTMEAMKMETTLYAEQDGKVAEVLVSAGTQVDTGDLVIQME